MKDDNKYNILQTVFIIMCANGLFTHGHAIDAEHARRAAMFRLVLSVVGLVGLIGVQIAKRREAAKLAAPGSPEAAQSPAADPRRVEVTYSASRADHWRCNMYATFSRWQAFLVISILPLLLTMTLAVPALHVSPIAGVIALLFVWLGWYGFLFGVLWLQILQRLPYKESKHSCITALQP